jgi:hypothetical protein
MGQKDILISDTGIAASAPDQSGLEDMGIYRHAQVEEAIGGLSTKFSLNIQSEMPEGAIDLD